MIKKLIRTSENIYSLNGWVDWFVDVITILAAFMLPVVYLLTFPGFIAGGKFSLIMLDLIVWVLVLIRAFIPVSKLYLPNIVWVLILYIMTISFFVTLGPNYARPAWMMFCAIMVAILYGVRGAILSSSINVIILFVLFFLCENTSVDWSRAHSEGLKNWIMFAGNFGTLTLLASISVGFLMSRLDRSLQLERNAKEELFKSEKKYRLIAENTGDLISIIDMNLRFTYVSPATMRLRGFTVEEAMEQTLEQVLTPESMRLSLAVFEKEMQLETSGTADPNRIRIFELEEFKKDGSTIWVEVSLSFMRDKDGKPNEILIVTRDITERRQAAEELRRSETRLIEAQHITHTGNWELDIQSNILKWSDEIFNIFEIDKDRFGESYESFLSAIHPDDREIVNGAYTRSLETREPYEITHRLLMSDGRIKFVHEQCNTRFSAEGKPLISIGIIQDITVRKNSEEALQKSEAMYRSIIEASPDAITITNLEGQILFVSSPALKLYCIETEDELLGHVIFDFISPEDRERALSNVSLMFQGIMTGPAEYHGIRSDGSNFVLEANCEFILNAERQPDSMVFIARDITERKRSKEALMESEKKFRTIFESAGDSIFIMDGAAIADCNTKTLLMFGISMEEIIGHNPADFSPEYQPDGKSSAEKVMEKIDAAYDGNPQFFEWVHVRMDETQFSVDVNLTRILLDGRYHLQAILRDITKRKIREKEHSLLQTQLQQAQKMESIGRLAGGVAHDFNNMLGVILGQTELIMIDLPENDPIKDNLKIIRQAAENSVVLTRQLLAFARRQVVSPKELNLNEVVEGTIKMLRRLIGEDINLLWEPGNDLNQVLIDPGQVDQLLANLCVNARDAINGSGRITIETENVSFDDNYCAGHLGCQPGKYVMLSISDDGSGMTREVQERIFEPFYTTKGIGKGTGLGLATVYGIVKQNDGFISVYSEVGKGTSFKIYLKQTDVSPNCNMPVTEIETLQGQGETVLLVEDEIKLLELTRVMLEKIGYNVLTADTPGQAIELAENPENIIHILITDVIMPELNGRDLFNKIVKSRPGIKCLYMSGYTSDIIAHHGVLKEGVNFLPKPFSLKVLSVKLREVLDSVVNA